MVNILLLYLSGPALFFILKLANAGIRFSDTNLYFYTAYELIKGKVLYKDIFFTNLPLFPYLSMIYYWLTAGSLKFYYLTAMVEVIASSLLISYLIFTQTKKHAVAVLAQTTYLFSFIVLSTSDHQTGVFAASLFSLIAYLFFSRSKNFLAGIFLALMVLVKAYYLPIAAAFIIFVFFRKKGDLFFLAAGFIVAITAGLFPFMVFYRKEFLNNVFYYSLFRSAGLNKANILLFFIRHDPALVLLFLASFFNAKNKPLLFWISVLSTAFVLVYKDVYYLYLNLITPFLTLSLVSVYQTLKKNKANVFIIAGTILLGVMLTGNLYLYINNYAGLGKINDLETLVKDIKKEKPNALYGAMDIAPALSYFTGTPLLNNIVDTNENLFNKGVLNAEKLTNEALRQRTIIISQGVHYPLQNINEPLIDQIFIKDKIFKSCRLIDYAAFKSEGIVNRINLFKCY